MKYFAAILLSACAFSQPLSAEQVNLNGRPVLEAATRLKPGQFVWAPDAAPEGPVLMVVNLATQRAILFRNGVPIGASTVSSGKKGYDTPTGVFTVLEKKKEHYSKTYNNAPMPNMGLPSLLTERQEKKPELFECQANVCFPPIADIGFADWPAALMRPAYRGFKYRRVAQNRSPFDFITQY